MAIVDEDLERVRSAVAIVDVVGQYVQLKRVGRRWVGLCPFHAEKTPSFNVNDELGLFICRGCQKAGDLITFVREIEHTDFVGAVEFLAAKAGIALRYTSDTQTRDRQQRKELIDALGRAADWYHRRLLEGDDAGPARAYLRSRGINGDVARQFKLGWAPDGWDHLARSLRLPDAVLGATGLGFVNSRQRQQDTFRARLMFPIYNEAGDPVAFGGRVLPGSADPAKYKNSPETAVYAKSRTLYGLQWAKADIVTAGEVIVCEGYTDVIGLHRAGLPRAVAACGTALTEDHVRLMKRFASRIVLAMDADEAGQSAAARFYEWEEKHRVEVLVAALPKGADPADLAGRDPNALATAVRDARPLLRFRIGRVQATHKVDTPEARARAAEDALKLVAEHPNPMVQSAYAGEIAITYGFSQEDLANRVRRGLRGPLQPPVVDRGARRRRDDGAEVAVLRLLVHRFADIAPYLTESLFTGPDTLGAFRAMAAVLAETPDAPVSQLVHRAIEHADPAAAELLTRLAVDEVDAEVDASSEARNLIAAVARREWQRANVEARGAGDLKASAALVEVRLWIDQLARAAEPNAESDAAGQLLLWLDGRAEER